MYNHGSYEEELLLSLCGFLESYYNYNLKNVDMGEKDKRLKAYEEILPFITQITDKDLQNKMTRHLDTFKSIPIQDMVRTIYTKFLNISPFLSSTLLYFDFEKIKSKILEYTKHVTLQEKLADIIRKTKDLEIVDDVYSRTLRLGCLRKEIGMNPQIMDELLQFVKFLYLDEFPREIRKYRNEFAHGKFNPKRRLDGVKYGDSVSHLVENLHFTSSLCILNEMKFSETKLMEIVHLNKPCRDLFNLVTNINF